MPFSQQKKSHYLKCSQKAFDFLEICTGNSENTHTHRLHTNIKNE